MSELWYNKDLKSIFGEPELAAFHYQENKTNLYNIFNGDGKRIYQIGFPRGHVGNQEIKVWKDMNRLAIQMNIERKDMYFEYVKIV